MKLGPDSEAAASAIVMPLLRMKAAELRAHDQHDRRYKTCFATATKAASSIVRAVQAAGKSHQPQCCNHTRLRASMTALARQFHKSLHADFW